MSDLKFPSSLRPIVSKGYGQTRGGNISRTNVQGGMPRQSRDNYYDSVPVSVTLVTGALGRQAFWSFITKADGGASSFQMNHDTGLGIQPHNVLITSTISETTQDGLNWVIQFTATAERTAIQDSNCLTENLPDLYGCYGDGLNCFLDAYEQYCTSYPFLWDKYGPQGYASINMQALTLDSRVVYTGPQISYLNSAGLLATSATNEWPLTFIGGVAGGRVPPEGFAFNAVLQSLDMTSAAWVKSAVVNTPAASGGLIPAGTFTITPTIANSAHSTSQNITGVFVAGDMYTMSFIIKAAGYNYARIRAADNTAFISDCLVNLLSGQIVSGGANSTVTALGGGWLRVTETVTIRVGGATSLNINMGVFDDSQSVTFPGDGIKAVLVCAMQVEVGAVSSSPIPTITALEPRPTATAKVYMNGAISIDVRYSDGSSVNVPAIVGYATIPQADTAWGSKYITRIDFNV